MRDIAKIIRRMHARCSTLDVEIVRVPGAGSARQVFWRFTRPPEAQVIQVESPDGMCPFLVGSNQGGPPLVGTSVHEVVDIICGMLNLQP